MKPRGQDVVALALVPLTQPKVATPPERRPRPSAAAAPRHKEPAAPAADGVTFIDFKKSSDAQAGRQRAAAPAARGLRERDTLRRMALVPCPECKAMVSRAAAACPQCGFPFGGATVPGNMFASTRPNAPPNEEVLWEGSPSLRAR